MRFRLHTCTKLDRFVGLIADAVAKERLVHRQPLAGAREHAVLALTDVATRAASAVLARRRLAKLLRALFLLLQRRRFSVIILRSRHAAAMIEFVRDLRGRGLGRRFRCLAEPC